MLKILLSIIHTLDTLSLVIYEVLRGRLDQSKQFFKAAIMMGLIKRNG